jgi:hypothetical protein
MLYEPYNTGWIKPIYGTICLTWFLLSNSRLPHIASVTCYNNIFIPFTKLINKFCEFLGNIIVSFGSKLIQFESFIFNQFNYINPIYNGLKLIESMFGNVNINTCPPSYHYVPSNIRRCKTSTGKHLCSFFARKRHLWRQQVVISGSNLSKNDSNAFLSIQTRLSILWNHVFILSILWTIHHVKITPDTMLSLLTGLAE